MQDRPSRGFQDTRNGTPRLVLRDGGRPTHRHTHTRARARWPRTQCGRVPSSMELSWWPPRTLLEPVCDRFTVRRTSPRCAAPSHVQACHSFFCNFVLRLLVGDHLCVLVTWSCVCFFHGFTVTSCLLFGFPDAQRGASVVLTRGFQASINHLAMNQPCQPRRRSVERPSSVIWSRARGIFPEPSF